MCLSGTTITIDNPGGMTLLLVVSIRSTMHRLHGQNIRCLGLTLEIKLGNLTTESISEKNSEKVFVVR